MGKKQGTDAKRSRPKADQTVSSVSAALALVDTDGLLLKKKTVLAINGFGLFLWARVLGSSETHCKSKNLCVRCCQICTKVHTDKIALVQFFQPQTLASLSHHSSFLLMPTCLASREALSRG